MITPLIEKCFLANPLSAQHILERTLEQKYSPMRFQVKQCFEDNRALTCYDWQYLFWKRTVESWEAFF